MKLKRKYVRLIRNILDVIRIFTFMLGFLLAGIGIICADGGLKFAIICIGIGMICFGISYVIDRLFYTE